MPTFLPDDFEAVMLDEDERHTTVKGMVLRQQLLRLAMKGLDATKAARLVGCGVFTARAIYREPDFRKEVYSRVDSAFVDVDKVFGETKKTLHERLAEQAYKAFETLETMLSDQETSPHLKAKIAMDFLDRNPETQPGRTVTYSGSALASEQLAQAAKMAREMDSKIVVIRKEA